MKKGKDGILLFLPLADTGSQYSPLTHILNSTQFIEIRYCMQCTLDKNDKIRFFVPVHIEPSKRAPDIRRFKPNVPTSFIIARQPIVKIIPKT